MSLAGQKTMTRRDSRVSMVFHRPTTFLRIEPNAYRFRPTGFWAPVQRFCWWVLGQSKALRRHTVEEEYFTRLDFDGDRALAKIMNARSEMCARARHPTKVLVGAEDMVEIMRDTDFREVAFSAQPMRFIGHIGYRDSILGLEVEVVPHMRGVLVL